MPFTEDILSISDNVLSKMMQFEVVHNQANADDLPKQDMVTGCVQVSGE